MMKVTTKTKKADLIEMAMELTIFPDVKSEELEAKYTAKDLYLKIKQYLAENQTAVETEISTTSEPVAQDVPTVPVNAENANIASEATPVSNVSEEVAATKTTTSEPSNEGDQMLINSIVAGYEALTAKLVEVNEENKKLNARLARYTKRDSDIYNSYVDMMNKVASTKDPKLVWAWTMLKDFSKKLGKCENTAIILDIEKLILEESIRIREEQELQARLEQQQSDAAYAEVTYDSGTHINYINGKAAIPVGVKKSVYKEYLTWYEDCFDWVTYIVDELTTIGKLTLVKKQKAQIKDLHNNVETWIESWVETCDDDTVDMVRGIVDSLFADKHTEKAMSNLVALIDELDLV